MRARIVNCILEDVDFSCCHRFVRLCILTWEKSEGLLEESFILTNARLEIG